MEFKDGDVVICLPGFINGDTPYKMEAGSTKHGGSGYKNGKVFKIGRISPRYKDGFILWPSDGSNGVYSSVVKKYSDRKSRIDDLMNKDLGKMFLPTSNRVPKDEWRLIAIDVYDRYVMEYQINKNNIIYITEEQFKKDFVEQD